MPAFIELDQKLQQSNNLVNLVGPKFWKSLLRFSKVTELSQIKMKPCFMQNSLCLERSYEIKSIILQNLLAPQLLSFHQDLKVEHDANFSDRLVKITIPNCAVVSLELKVFFNEFNE